MTQRDAINSGQRPARPGEVCTCGRPAVLVFGNRWGGCTWCGTNNLGPVDSAEAESARVELQKRLGRPLRQSDLEAVSC